MKKIKEITGIISAFFGVINGSMFVASCLAFIYTVFNQVDSNLFSNLGNAVIVIFSFPILVITLILTLILSIYSARKNENQVWAFGFIAILSTLITFVSQLYIFAYAGLLLNTVFLSLISKDLYESKTTKIDIKDGVFCIPDYILVVLGGAGLFYVLSYFLNVFKSVGGSLDLFSIVLTTVLSILVFSFVVITGKIYLKINKEIIIILLIFIGIHIVYTIFLRDSDYFRLFIENDRTIFENFIVFLLRIFSFSYTLVNLLFYYLMIINPFKFLFKKAIK
jgi:hypothetical protein